MIPLNIILAFLLSFPINPLVYPYGYHIAAFGATKIVPIVMVITAAKIIDLCFCIHVRLLTWMYRNNYRTFFKIFVYMVLHFDESRGRLTTQFLLNACMWHAISKDNVNLLSFLLECGANPNIVYLNDNFGEWSFHDAIGHNNCHPNKSLLAEACQKNNAKFATMLLQHGAYPDGNVSYYNYSIMGDCQAYFSSSINDCKNPLLIACHNNNSEIVKLLIRHNTKTHPFVDRMLMRLENTDTVKMGDNSVILKDCKTSICREIAMSAISFTLCNQNRDLFNILALYTLKKNDDLPNSFSFMSLALFNQEQNSPLQLLPTEIKHIIWSNICYHTINEKSIGSYLVRKKSIWLRNYDDQTLFHFCDFKISTRFDDKDQKYLENKIEAVGFYSPPKLTISNQN